ncbi:MAG TPA: outer membrane protein assembly factor BamE [Usitatibacter sp.]|nr:outer membrane protein assembly factor BamE [Usitatibacter sp.]
MRSLAATLLALALGGCSLVYTIDIQQGNYVTEDVVTKLRVGMTKAEVRQLLGTPLLIDTFHQNRWDYFFSDMKRGKPDTPPSRLSIFFENEKVKSFVGEARPAALAPVGATAAPQPVIK